MPRRDPNYVKAPRSYGDVAHQWAHRLRSDGRYANMSYRYEQIYSYATPIARHLDDNTVLMSTRYYSSSTSNHQGYVSGAIRHKTVIRCYDINDSHNQIKTRFEKDYEEAVIKASRARVEYRLNGYIGEANSLRENYQAYSDWYKLNWTPLEPISDDMLAAAKKRAAEKAKLSRIAQAERERKRAEMEREALAKWRAGEYVPMRLSTTALRLKDDEIQTTQGAHIPKEHAIKVWPLLKRMHDDGSSYQRNGHTIHLGPYALDNFNLDGKGTLKAGCHTIPWPEIEAMSKELGL